MKTIFRRRAKSVLAIVLSLCMVLSVFTVGIASASAATAGESVGSYNVSAKIYVQKPSGWSNVSVIVGKSDYSTAYKMSKLTGTNLYYKSVSWDGATEVGFMDADWGSESGEGKKMSDRWGGVSNKIGPIGDGTWKFENGGTYRVDPTASSPYSTYYSGGYGDLNKKLTIKTAYSENGDNYTETSTKYGTFSASGAYKLTDNGTSSSSSVSQTNGTGELTTVRTNTATISQSPNSGYTFVGWKTSLTANGSGVSTGTYSFTNSGSAATVYAYYKKTKTTLTTPSNVKINNASTYAVNAGDSSTTTLTWTGDSNANGYTIYRDGNQVGTSATTSYSLSNATSAAGTYTVKATNTDTSNYINSAISTSSATLTVYEPLYSLSGNDVYEGAILINGSAPTPTDPTGTNTNFNTYQTNYAINTPTTTPGVYKLTFTVKEDVDGRPDVSIAQTGNTQRAFILNGDAYNISTHGDITITDAGITDANNLYLYNIGTPAGGSLYLKKGQTYTITIDQTQRYNSSSPYGKITIETGDIFAETAAKKQAFNPTNGNWDAVSDADTTVGTASSSPLHGPKSSLTTDLTATVVNSDYEFIGWYTSDTCSGDPTIAASACTKSDSTYTKSVTISSSTTYYALFKQKAAATNTATLVQTSFGTLSITGGATGSGNSYTAYRGATVSINATTTDNSKTFSRWVITNATTHADITSTVCASPSQATSSFTMPAQNVEITAVYANKTSINITVSSNNPALGTADLTNPGTTYYVGDSIPVTATPASGLTGGVFVKWVVTGGVAANANSASTTITQTGATVTAKAVFETKTFQLYYNGVKYTMLRTSDGKYISTRKVNYSGGQFTIYDVSANEYAVTSSNPYELHSGYTAGPVSSWNASSSQNKYRIKSDDSNSYFVRFDPSNGTDGTVDILSANPMGDFAQIYAKDGSIRYSDTNQSSGDLWETNGGGTTANRGVTVITQINGTSVPNPDAKRYPSTTPTLSEHLKIYSAAIGNTITIQTTMNDTYKTQGFYVGMFVVNGWKVEATDVGNGKYTATYTLSSEYAVNNLSSVKSFEITPVYYNKNFEYVTFYVDAASVPSKWGKTISACADYNGATNAHFEGTYPGQPLGREGDLYEMKVSKYYYDYSNNKWNKHTNYQPSVTITAYNFDLVHHYYYVKATDEIYQASNNDNFQTYDFSDFNYLAKIPDIEAILFRCKPEETHSSWQIYGKADNSTGDNGANYNAKTPDWYYVDDKYTQFNTWQVLTDYYGNPIDALGNRIVKSGSGDSAEYYTAADVSSLTYSPNSSSRIRIVSYGNRKTDDDTANSRTAAKWASGWAVYGGGSTGGTNYQIAYGTPADFICTTPGTDSTSNVHYINGKSSSALKNKITYITYDKERTNKISGVGDTGERIDGQWYYSAQHDFDSNVKVAITTATGTAITTSNTNIEVDSNSANNTGYIGSTSGTKATLDDNTTHTYSNVTTEAELKATVGSGYVFVGWYIYDGSSYVKINDNFADINTTMLMKKNYTIVAVVRQVGQGDLVITHSRYTGSSPEAHDGTGKYYVSAVVNPGTASERTIAEALNSITVSGLTASDTLQIKLRTVCNGVDTFYAWYEEALNADYTRTGNYYEICSETEDPLGETEASYTFFEADCSTFFNGNTLARKTIDLYSDIVHVSAFATLTYKYYDRFETSGANQMVSYTVKKVPLSDDEIAAGFIPSDTTISKYAPKVVDTIYTDTKWTIAGTKVERAASNVTLMATQTPKDCYVGYLPNSAVASTLLQSLTTEAAVEDVPVWTNKTVEFNSWLIDDNADIDNPQEADFYVNAPMSYTYTSGGTSKTWSFVRFDVYSRDRLTGEIGNVIFSSNDNYFGYRIYSDCVIYPVYSLASVTPELTAVIEPAILNREVYGDSASATDKLYADLIVSYINAAAATGGAVPEEIRANETTYSIETGVILDKSVNLNTADYNTLKTAALNGTTDTTDTIIAGYSGFTALASVETLAKNSSSTTSGNLTKYINDNSHLTNKNRLDKVFRYNNTEAAQKRVFAAYSYVVIRDSSNNIVAWAVSNQQRFNLCYVGNKPLETVS